VTSTPSSPGTPARSAAPRHVGAEGVLRAGSTAGRWVLAATVLGSALAAIDATVVTIALPTIAEDLGASFGDLQWTVTGYSVTLAALILFSGAAGDRFGRRRLFLVGVLGFTVASVLCAAAPTIGALIAARVLQGVGGALLTPSSLAIIEAVFDPRDRAAAVGTWAGFSGVAGAVAPFAGGWLLDLGSWRWVFLVNVPVAALVVAVVVRHVPETRNDEATGGLDWVGSVASVLFLGAGTYAIIEAPNGRGGLVVALAAVLSLVLLLAFLLWERRSPHPLLPLGLFRIRQFSAVNAVTFIVYGALGTFFFLLVLQLQLVAGWSPLLAGSSTIPVTVLVLVFSRWSGVLGQRIGPRPQMTVGPLLCALGTVLALRIGRDASYLRDVVPAVLVLGIGLAAMVAPLTATALSSVPTSNAGLASGVNNALARSASLLGIAGIPVAAGLTGDSFQDPGRFDDGFRTAALACAVLFAVGGLLAGAAIRRPVASPASSRADV
jgi:EmrB/QacA subfamily drug resistance transporter